MKKHVIVFLAIVTLVLIFSSCKKDKENDPGDNPDAPTCLLTKITDNEGYFCEYAYSSTGKLTTIHDGYLGNESYWFYYYDNQGRVSYEVRGSSDTTYYYYNTDNKIIMAIEPIGVNGPDTVFCEYNQSKQLISLWRENDGVTIAEYTYEWGEDGNVQKEKFFTNDQLDYTETFEYDNKVSRISTERGPLMIPLNKNNETIVYTNGTISRTYTYSYDSNNLPIEFTLVGNGFSITASNTYDCN